MKFLLSMFSGSYGALIYLIGMMFTEKLYKRVIARLLISLLNWFTASTETKVDDKAVAPLVEMLEKEI